MWEQTSRKGPGQTIDHWQMKDLRADEGQHTHAEQLPAGAFPLNDPPTQNEWKDNIKYPG
jgi:hypothetical protein